MEESYLRFYELYTENGTLYFYEKYKEDPNKPFNNEIPEIYEFFTQESGTRGYDDISFLDGKARFKRERKDSEGITKEWYLRLLTPSEFLERVLPFLDDQLSSDQKAKEVMKILEAKATGTILKDIIVPDPKPTENQRNKVAKKILKEYIK